MPNGKPHDNPISDITIHGMHPFPSELEALVLRLHKMNPMIINDLEWAPFDWEKGEYIEEAKILLKGLIDNHGDPDACHKLLTEYKDKYCKK